MASITKRKLSLAWLCVAVFLPVILLLPVLISPHYGLFSDAGQAIAFPRDFLNNLPRSLILLRPLEDGRWNPLFHGLTIMVYAIAPDSPRALYVAQLLSFIGITVSMSWLLGKLTGSFIFAIVGSVLFCFSSGVFENFFTLDKVEPRITLFTALAVASLVAMYLEAGSEETSAQHWRRFIGIQALLGTLLVFSKETGVFLGASFLVTWVVCLLNPHWGSRLDKPAKLGALTHMTIILIFVILFKILSFSMSYRYVRYDISFALIIKNLTYYALASPELALGSCAAIYWSLACTIKRLPGPYGVHRVILTFMSIATLAYLSGLLIWRWALEYYILPAQFMAIITLVLTSSTLVPFFRRRFYFSRLLIGFGLVLWLSYLVFRIFVGSAVFAQDAVKDQLAKLLAEERFKSSRLILPYVHPDSAEIGERLKFFIDRERPPKYIADLYNFWEMPFLNRDKINRFSNGAGISPGASQMLEVANNQEKYAIWQYGSTPNSPLATIKKRFDRSSNGIPWTPDDIWHVDYLHVGDLILVPVGNPWLRFFTARGIEMYSQSLSDFMLRTPIKMTRVGGATSGIQFAQLGWEVLQVDKIPEDDPTLPYGVYRLLSKNLRADVVPYTSTETLIEEYRLPANGLLLGNGWYDLEAMTTERFRWMGEQSEIVITHPRAGQCGLDLDFEPIIQPGLSPVVLTAKTGEHSVNYQLNSRQTIRFDFTAEDKPLQLIRIEIHGGMNAPPPGDLRILKARTFGLRLRGECVQKPTLGKQ